MKKMIFSLPIMALFLVGCKSNIAPSTSETSKNDIKQTSDTPATSSNAGSSNLTSSNQSSSDSTVTLSNAIVVYFSATNHTKAVADEISSYYSIPEYVLEPVNPYTSADLNWSNQNSRVVREHNDSSRHVELTNVNFAGFDDAKYIFLGAPVWWQELSWVVDDYLKLNDFSGKTIIPFATSSSSGYSTTRHEAMTPGAVWMNGQRFSSNVSTTAVDNWLKGLNINVG